VLTWPALRCVAIFFIVTTGLDWWFQCSHLALLFLLKRKKNISAVTVVAMVVAATEAGE
jgi:hypothetical protein